MNCFILIHCSVPLRWIEYSHGFNDLSYFVLVGSTMKTVPCVKHIIQVPNLLKNSKQKDNS